jgi:ankyrin repeat protein
MSFYTAARDGQIDLLRQHLQNGADVHQRFNNDRTALHFA